MNFWTAKFHFVLLTKHWASIKKKYCLFNKKNIWLQTKAYSRQSKDTIDFIEKSDFQLKK